MPLSNPIRSRLCRCCAGVLALLSLGACQLRGDNRPLSSELPPPPVFAPTPTQCEIGPARFALGRHITAPLLEEMRMQAGARMARTALATDPPLPPDPQRLTVEVEPTGRIVGLRCG